MPLYRDEAVVLRTQKLGEADRIVTLLTRRHGRVRCVARGVRKTTSRIGARLEPFGHVDVQLYEGRSLDSVNQVDSIAAHGADLVHDYTRWTTGTAMLETAERMTPVEREPALQQYALLVAGLRRPELSLLALDRHGAIVARRRLDGWEPEPGTALQLDPSSGRLLATLRPIGADGQPAREPRAVLIDTTTLELDPLPLPLRQAVWMPAG